MHPFTQFCLQLGVPDEVLQSLASNPDPDPLLDGSHCVALLRLVPEHSLGEYQSFLGTRLATELKGLPRGAIQMAMVEAGSATPLHRDVQAAVNKLQRSLGALMSSMCPCVCVCAYV